MNCTGPTAQRRAKKRRDRLRAYVSACKKVDARDGKACRVCRCMVLVGAHHHHVKARSLGGTHTTDNLIRICQQCHYLIHAKRIIVTGNADEQLHIERVA